MPVYTYECECGTRETDLVPMSEADQPRRCACARVSLMRRVVSPALMRFAPHADPAWDTFRAEHRQWAEKGLKDGSLRPYEGPKPGNYDGRFGSSCSLTKMLDPKYGG